MFIKNPTRIFTKYTRMITKLTLTVEKAVIQKAKSYAKKTGRSLSEIVENYLEKIINENGDEQISPKLKKLVGSVSLPKKFNEKEELLSYFERKHS